MKPAVYLLSLGCPRNLVDSEVLQALLKKKGFSITEDISKAGVYIVNTCSFIKSAKEESIDAILELAAVKKDSAGGDKKLIVAGCLSQRYPKDLKKEIPEIDAIFGSSDFIKIPSFISRSMKNPVNVSRNPGFLYDDKSPRALITPTHYAYIKIQEGCKNLCSYCLIPRLRGPYRSREFNSVIKEVRTLRKKNDVKEINLIGQDTTLYGIDRYKTLRLHELLKELSAIMKNRWIRLLYTHPAHYSDELIEVIAGEGAICKYLDIPIQHINDRILKLMNRNTTKFDIITLIEKLKKKMPGLAIRTSVMVGFPGETEKEFEELVDFIKDVKFERLGAFIYSPEEGSPAYKMKNQIPEKIKQKRFDAILKVQQDISRRMSSVFLDKKIEILIDESSGKEDTQFLGRSRMDAPEVDGVVYVKSKKPLKIGEFYNVKVTDTLEYDLVGEIV